MFGGKFQKQVGGYFGLVALRFSVEVLDLPHASSVPDPWAVKPVRTDAVKSCQAGAAKPFYPQEILAEENLVDPGRLPRDRAPEY